MSEEIQFPPTMSNSDALIWYVERDPKLQQTTAAVTLLDRPPDREVLGAKLRCAVHDLPRLRQRVITLPRAISTPIWSEDPNFSLDYHLRWLRAPRGESFSSILDLAASLVMQGFDRSRPLWEFIVVEEMEGGRAAVIQKLHHAVTDAAAGMLLMQRVYDLDPEAHIPEPQPSRVRNDGEAGVFQTAAKSLLRSVTWPSHVLRSGIAQLRDFSTHPVEITKKAITNLASVVHVFNSGVIPLSPITKRRSSNLSFATLSVPVSDLKTAAHAANCKLNDAFLASVAAGWRRYHDRHGTKVENLRVMVPLDLRRERTDTVAGNQFMMSRVPVPVGEADPKKRMQKIKNLVAIERSQTALAYVEALAGLMTYIPSLLLPRLFGIMLRSNDFVAACVPGLSVPLYMAGARVDSLFTFGPPAGSAANITLFSYLDQAAVTITLDRAAVPDHHVLFECMQEGFNEVLNVG